MLTFDEQIEAIVSARNYGKPTAAKRGRNPRWPYVPVIDHSPEIGKQRTEQIKKRAYVTREEAVAYAASVIEARKAHDRQLLKDPRMRAVRRAAGLPEDL